MPILCKIECKPLQPEEFKALDRLVMRHAFDIHNILGRFCDEKIYQTELAKRLQHDGVETHREVPITISYKTFSKTYYIDLLAVRGIIYELKCVKNINTANQAQLINYLLLTGLINGKLINFRGHSVEHRFVSTTLSQTDRMQFSLRDQLWDNNLPGARKLKELCCDILNDWGCFLSASLYQEALLHFTSGPNSGALPVEIHSNGAIAGTQSMNLLNPSEAWHLSSIHQYESSYKIHLQRLLNHTKLEHLHWINMNNHTIIMETLKRQHVLAAPSHHSAVNHSANP
jgi:GxxExxY protein